MKELLVLTLFFVVHYGHTQSICENSAKQEIRVQNCSDKVSNGILTFNEIAKHFSLKDTFSYTCKDDKLVYQYKGEIVNNWAYEPEMCGKKLMLNYCRYSDGFQLLITIPIKDNVAQVYEAIRIAKGNKQFVFKEYKEQGILPVGEYTEKDCAGTIIAKGKYEIENMTHTYSYNFYDCESRKIRTGNIESIKRSAKTGMWSYFDAKGKALYKENYSSNKFETTKSTQELCSDFEKETIYNYYNVTKSISPAIELFNSINATQNKKMHLSYDITHRGITYYLNGKIVPNPFFKFTDGYKPWEFQIRNNNNNFLLEYLKKNRLKIYIPVDEVNGEILIFNGNKYSTVKFLDVFETINYNLNGKFERRDCNGNLVSQGNYKTVQLPPTIEEEGNVTDTNEKPLPENLIDYKTVRSGQWSYYGKNGEKLLEENYPGDRKWFGASDYLCATSEEEVKEMTTNIRRDFMDFNTICDQLSQDTWISRDIIMEGNHYYVNGEWVDPPEDISKKNYHGDYRFKTPNSTIEILSNTKRPSLIGKNSTNRNPNYSISITYDDGKIIELSCLNNKLKKQESRGGLRDGKYLEKKCDGKLLVDGQYCQIEGSYRDTIKTMDPNTYETKIMVREFNQIPRKYGTWNTYDNQGILIKEEDHGKCE